LIQILAENLRSPLAGAHHIRWIDGLVRGNHHEGLATEAVREFSHGSGTQYIIPGCLPDLALQHRDMFVGSRVKDDFRPGMPEDFLYRHLVNDIV
jgi:hypothetical protein